MRPSDLLRYGLWAAVAATAARNRKEYGVPTAWLTHLAGNTFTLFLPELLRLVPVPTDGNSRGTTTFDALLRTLDLRARQDPNYAVYVAPLALGFIFSHPDYSIYHGPWAERSVFGFGADSIPHSTAAYALARLMSESLLSLDQELPASSPLAQPVSWAAGRVDAIAAGSVLLVTLIWEVSEYLAQAAEMAATGKSAEEVNMQWSVPDAITDTISNVAGLLAAIVVRHLAARSREAPPPLSTITAP
jgi:hypothetical protein